MPGICEAEHWLVAWRL